MDKYKVVRGDVFEMMRAILQAQVSIGGTPESYFELLEGQGKSPTDIQAVHQQHDQHWQCALTLIHDAGSYERTIQAAAERVVPSARPSLRLGSGQVHNQARQSRILLRRG